MILFSDGNIRDVDNIKTLEIMPRYTSQYHMYSYDISASTSFTPSVYTGMQYPVIFEFYPHRIVKQGGSDDIGHYIGMLEDELRSTTSTTSTISIGDVDTSISVPRHYPFTEIFKIIENLAEANGLILHPLAKELPESQRFILYFSPAIREMWNPDINLKNLLYSHGLPNYFFEYDSFNDLVAGISGTKSKRMRNEVWKRVYHTKEQNVEYIKPVQPGVVSEFGAFANDWLADSGYRQERDYYYVKKELKLNVFSGIKFLTDLLPLNYIYDLLDAEVLPSYFDTGNYEPTVEFFKEKYTPKKLLSFIQSEEFRPSYILDIFHQYTEYDSIDKIPYKIKYKYPNGIVYPKRVQSLKELHDKITLQFNEIQSVADNKDIGYTSFEMNLHNYTMKYTLQNPFIYYLQDEEIEYSGEIEIKLILPPNSKTLVEWGKLLKHCIGGYGSRAANKDYLLIGVEINGELRYTIQANSVVKKEEVELVHEPGPDGVLTVDENGFVPLVFGETMSVQEALDRLAKCFNGDFIRQFYGWNNTKNKPTEEFREFVTMLIEEVLLYGEKLNEEDIRSFNITT